ncbi:ExbD/TolR family protein [Hymenobacter sp. HD11105]
MNRRKGIRVSASRLAPDMTSMVGLGFLLVTFFIMAGNFTKPMVMAMTMPVRPTCTYDSFNPMSYRKVVTLILGKDHQIYYYFGENSAYNERPALHNTNFSPTGLRQILLNQQRQNSFDVVLIKMTADAKYKDMVDALDEMNITNQRKYAMVNIYPEDMELLKMNAL